MSYTKLFHRIVTSSIWDEPNTIRIVWITMLAMANQDGYVGSTVKALAMLARVSVTECDEALRVLSGPDEASRSPENDGRRIEAVQGGWILLNYEKHRNSLSDDPNAVAARERQRRHRDKQALRNVTSRDTVYASASVSDSEGESEGGFQKPTLQEVTEYAKLHNLTVDPEGFWLHYDAIGWMAGKSPLLNWRAKLAQWQKNEKATAAKKRVGTL